MLGTLLTGFLAGLGTYEGALKIMSLETISKDRLKQLESGKSGAASDNGIYSVALPDYLNPSELELIFTKVKEAYNKRDTGVLYQLMGPVSKAQLTEEVASLQMQPVYENLGKLESGFYVQHQFVGQQGLYKFFTLNFSATYEKAKKGVVSITVIDDGKTYQINGLMFNRL